MESPFKPELLMGKVALLTGGGSGIGFEISTQFGRHGASVAIMGRRRHVLDAAVAALQSEGIPVNRSTQILFRIRVKSHLFYDVSGAVAVCYDVKFVIFSSLVSFDFRNLIFVAMNWLSLDHLCVSWYD